MSSASKDGRAARGTAGKVTVGAVNYAGIWADKAANLEKIERHIRDAAAVGVEIVAFPELAVSGYDCSEPPEGRSGPCSLHAESAETIPGPATDAIHALCRELGVYAIVSLPERDPDDAARLYISAAVIGPEGVVGTHRKTSVIGGRLFCEPSCFHAGTEVPVFETEHGRIAVLICYELGFVPELTRIAALKGAQIVFYVSSSPVGSGKPEYMLQQTGARATENLIYAVSANRTGQEPTRSYYGHSNIAGPTYPRLYRPLAQATDREELIYATLDMAAIDAWADQFNPAEHVNWDLISHEYAELAKRLGAATAPR
ncbi:MAG: 5-aminopentanamidase [Thermoleophilaceae bacterium]|jgi:predicted amidohydrolase|nr:5-aminopentanamidase [Thermoleophilaceae bacterium]